MGLLQIAQRSHVSKLLLQEHLLSRLSHLMQSGKLRSPVGNMASFRETQIREVLRCLTQCPLERSKTSDLLEAVV